METANDEIEFVMRAIVWGSLPGTLLNGLYLGVFIQCFTILVKQRRIGYKWQLFAISALFLSTAVYILHSAVGLTILADSKTQVAADDILYAAIFIVSDLIHIYRCYLVWDRRLVIILGLCIFLATIIISDVYDFVRGVSHGIIFWALAITMNVLITSLTAGRIWYINRISSNLLASEVQRRYVLALNLILESGIITLIFLVIRLMLQCVIAFRNIDTVIPHSKNDSFLIANGSIAMFHAVLTAMLPTLMLLRVAWGYDTMKTIDGVRSYREKTALA